MCVKTGTYTNALIIHAYTSAGSPRTDHAADGDEDVAGAVALVKGQQTLPAGAGGGLHLGCFLTIVSQHV